LRFDSRGLLGKGVRTAAVVPNRQTLAADSESAKINMMPPDGGIDRTRRALRKWIEAGGMAKNTDPRRRAARAVVADDVSSVFAVA
jgi:hypothetical protein